MFPTRLKAFSRSAFSVEINGSPRFLSSDTNIQVMTMDTLSGIEIDKKAKW